MKFGSINLLDRLDELVESFGEHFEDAETGDNVLIERGDWTHLLKFERFEQGDINPGKVRIDRGRYVIVTPSRQSRVVGKARVEILATHRINFGYDKEFGLYLPSADSLPDLYLDIGTLRDDNEIRDRSDKIKVITDKDEVFQRLREITRPGYFERNFLPFLESRLTDLQMPKEPEPSCELIGNESEELVRNGNVIDATSKFRPPRTINAHPALIEAVKEMKHGDFVYIGSKEEVYLFGLALDERDGLPYMQGTDVTSTKPMLWFSNNLLGEMSIYDFNKSLAINEPERRSINYRTEEFIGFNDEPFIFSAMGRKQNVKNTMFKGKPHLITGDLEKALKHFRTTDFAEFEDVVKAYFERIHEPTPGAERLEGERFYK